MQPKITFNGQEYSSLDEMPPDVRQAYEQMMNALGTAYPGLDQIPLQARQAFEQVVNIFGAQYSSLDEMPPEARQAFEQMMNAFADRNRDGMPDLFEGLASLQNAVAVNVIHFDGQTYTSLDEMPPEARHAYEKAMGALADRNRDGLPDVLAGADLAQAQPAAPGRPVAPASALGPDLTGDVEAGERNVRLLVIGGALALLVLAAVGLLAVFLLSQYLLPR